MAAKSLVAMLKFSDCKQILLYDVKWQSKNVEEDFVEEVEGFVEEVEQHKEFVECLSFYSL